MVTPEEARKQIEAQRKQLEEARAQIIRAKPTPPTKAELFKPGLQRLVGRKLEAERGARITQAEQQLTGIKGAFETRVAEVTPQIQAYEEQERLIQEVQDAAYALRRGSASFRKFSSKARELAQSQISAEKSSTSFNKTLQKLDLKAIFADGKLTGFEDAKLKQSYTIENLGIKRPDAITQLTKLGFFETKDIENLNFAFKDILTGNIVSAAKPPGATSVN